MKSEGYRIPSFSIIIAALCLSLIGLALAFLLPVKLSPTDTLPTLQVTFRMPGASAQVVESKVTSKLEGMMARVEGVKHIRSVSDKGGGQLTLELDRHVKRDDVRLEISSLIRQLWSQLPEGVTYPEILSRMPADEDEDGARPFQVYTLAASAQPQAIQQYGEDYVKPVLADIRDLYKVEFTGAVPMEWHLNYDTKLLENNGVSVNQVETAVRNYLQEISLGLFQLEGEEGLFRITASRLGKDGQLDLSKLSLTNRVGQSVALDRLVTLTHQEGMPQSYLRINGRNSIYMTLTATKEANQLVLAQRVQKALEQVHASLPAGYSIQPDYDSTEEIQKELDSILFRTGLTILLLLLFVVLITRDTRYTFLVVVSLAVNQAVAFVLYYLADLEIHLYSLAGITISINLVIDNIIVMADHVRHKHNLNAFLPILAATLTTMSALCMVFFLDEKLLMNLRDFALVVIVNMGVSLAAALLLVPALMDLLGMASRREKGVEKLKKHRWQLRSQQAYAGTVRFILRFRYLFLVLWVTLFASGLYIFVKKIYNGEYYDFSNRELSITINAQLPNGATIEQMNTLIGKMETYLSDFQEIEQFQTRIIHARRASIHVTFKKEYQKSMFPYQLNAGIISKALTLGGGSWSVNGIPDEGFSNSLRESNGGMRLRVLGYNYAELQHWAKVAYDMLMERSRIAEVHINAEFVNFQDDYREFLLTLIPEKLTAQGLSYVEVYQGMLPMLARSSLIGSVISDGRLESLRLTSLQNQQKDMWELFHSPVNVNGKTFKLSDVATLKMQETPQKIVKEDQQYQLCLQYDYKGAQEVGKRHLRNDAARLEDMMPMGYSTEVSEQSILIYSTQKENPFWLLFVVIGLVFLLSAILFNSLTQPLAIVLLIPTSFIGVFLTFWGLELRFDQGGFAAMILLCGITVNSGIYIMNACNTLRKERPKMTSQRLFVKACSQKITPILLTVFSTILGFVPFIVGDMREPFWFSLAMGTIGGLVASVIGLFIWLPAWILPRK